MRNLLVLATYLTLSSVAVAADRIGFKEFSITDDDPSRPLHAVLWYPTSTDGPMVRIAENKVWAGGDVVENGDVEAGSHPLVILSHGYGGSWRNQFWLANFLAGQGYVVAAADHPGTTFMDMSAEQSARLDDRPRDVSRMLDRLLSDTRLAGPIAAENIVAIGHSLGGWTVMELAGARSDIDQLNDDCRNHTELKACKAFGELGIPAERYPVLKEDRRDPRIRAVVSLDLGLARSFTPQSLGSIQVPALVIAAGTDHVGIPAELESGYLAEHMPAASTEYVVIPDATHFSFMGICQPGGGAIAEADVPGDGMICLDGGSRNREELHAEVRQTILNFIQTNLPTN